MNATILSALIGLSGSAFGALVGILVSQKLTQYRLEQLEKKMDNYTAAQATLEDRIYQLEQHNVVQDERMKVANHRLDDLERQMARGGSP